MQIEKFESLSPSMEQRLPRESYRWIADIRMSIFDAEVSTEYFFPSKKPPTTSSPFEFIASIKHESK